MSYYLDTNVMVSFFTEDDHSARVDHFFSSAPVDLLVSDWAAAEFMSVIHRKCRSRLMVQEAADYALSTFPIWRRERCRIARFAHESGDLCISLCAIPSLKLSAPDAMHLALAIQAGAILVTFDERLAEAARLREVEVLVP